MPLLWGGTRFPYATELLLRSLSAVNYFLGSQLEIPYHIQWLIRRCPRRLAIFQQLLKRYNPPFWRKRPSLLRSDLNSCGNYGVGTYILKDLCCLSPKIMHSSVAYVVSLFTKIIFTDCRTTRRLLLKPVVKTSAKAPSRL